MLLEFDKKHNGNATTNDWKQLALEMGRPTETLRPKLNDLKESKDISQKLKKTRYTLEDEVEILTYLNEHFEIGNPEKLKSLSWSRKDFQPLVKVLQRGELAIYNHFVGFVLPILLGNIYGTLNIQWEDEVFKYIIDQKVESIGLLDWDLLRKEKPFLTKFQITKALTHAKDSVKLVGPLYEQIAAFRTRIPTGRSSPKWIKERKLEINHIYDNMLKAKLLSK